MYIDCVNVFNTRHLLKQLNVGGVAIEKAYDSIQGASLVRCNQKFFRVAGKRNCELVIPWITLLMHLFSPI